MTDSRESVRQVSAELRARQPLPPLCPAAPWDRELSRRIAAAGLPPAVASALLLWNDDLDASHTLSQALPDRFGSWLHGAMHRREGDYSNSKYWFRKAGTHAGFAQMTRRASELLAEAGAAPSRPPLAALAARWDPLAFVTCALPQPTAAQGAAGTLQAAELELLTNGRAAELGDSLRTARNVL